MRCSRCHTRFTLKRKPDDTVRCPHCKASTVYSCEAARRREIAKQVKCLCSGYPFLHRRASLVGCLFHKDRLLGIPLTEDEEQHIAGTWARSRTAWRFGADSPTQQDKYNALPEAPF